jgi:hypothetical protein
LKPPTEDLPERHYDGRQLVEYPAVQLFVLAPVFSDTMENLRLQVCHDDALEEFEKAALYDLDPIELGILLLEFAQYEGDHHLVGLFIKLAQLNRTDLIVPTLHAGGIVDFQD